MFGWLVGWLLYFGVVGWLVVVFWGSWLVGWLVGCCIFGQLVGWLVVVFWGSWLVGWVVWVSWLVDLLVGLLVKVVSRRVLSEEVLAGTEIPGGGGRERLYLTLHCHHQNPVPNKPYGFCGR